MMKFCQSVVTCLLLLQLCVVDDVLAEKIPFVSTDERPAVTHYTGQNNLAAARSALLDGADTIVMTVKEAKDLVTLDQYIDLALSAQWERVVGLGIELKSRDLLQNVSQILAESGYTEGAPVFIISVNFDLLAQVPFIPVADLSELRIDNVTDLMDKLTSNNIKEVIASKEQIQPFDQRRQQLEYVTELYIKLKDLGIRMDVCCFNTDPKAPEFHGELINEIRHFLKLGGINALTKKPAVAFAVANEFLLSSGPDDTFDFAVISDLPHSEVESANGVVDVEWKSLMNEINMADLEFVVQLGNAQAQGQNCTEEYKQFIYGEFEASFHPLFYSPGEGEWKFCQSSSFSSSAIKLRQERIKELFATGDLSMGVNKLPVLRQSHLAAIMPEFSEFAENIIWEQNNILFVYPSVINAAGQSSYMSSLTLADFGVAEKATDQVDIQTKFLNYERQPVNSVDYDAAFAWLEFGFNEAQRRQSAGIVIVWHASEVFNFDANTQGQFEDLRLHMENLVLMFDRPVLLFHQGVDQFVIDKPLISSASGETIEMLTRVQCTNKHWVRVHANPDAADFNDVFMIKTKDVDRENGLAPVIAQSPEDGLFNRAEDTLSIAVLGGLPAYQPVSTWDNVLSDISQAHISFAVHVGDIKGPNTNCSNEYYEYILQTMNQVRHPLIYVPGEQDWANCNQESAGGYEPRERLEFIRSQFFSKPSMSLGKYPMPINPQSTEVPEYHAEDSIQTNGNHIGLPENAMWMQKGVVFATVHMIGANNNLDRQEQDTNDQYQERLEEYQARNQANIQFIYDVFDLANSEDAVGIIIFFNGNPFTQSRKLQLKYQDQRAYFKDQIQTGFLDAIDIIRNETLDFGNPVVFVHSDDQQFTVDKPFNQAPYVEDTYDGFLMQVDNLWRLQLPGLGQVWWVEIIIDPKHPDVFLFVPKLVRTNLFDHSPITPIWAADDPSKVCFVNQHSQEVRQYPGQ
eukprot:TRINITY_DN24200_c0_g1_i1.p1 TRINITY_DN24200_c0_g1~~TRINITY_DN24200_c0_g1_i1.p1  ORF type:complete len:969 (-),score=98.12 TRINITY_DN24200_c0_g1_i1:553-3459(-)